MALMAVSLTPWNKSKKAPKPRRRRDTAWVSAPTSSRRGAQPKKVVMGRKKPHVGLEPCYYGDRKVIYVHVRYPDMKFGQKMVTVYGKSFAEVYRVIDAAMTKAFGKVGANRPLGRRGGSRV